MLFYINCKIYFSTEKDFEECYQVLNELSTKSSEDMTMTGAWLTTLQGEILDCGCAKISGNFLQITSSSIVERLIFLIHLFVEF